jgi:hypothetical protein
MVARIYQPAKTAMQSGRAKTERWLLVYEPEQPQSVEPLMGYTSAADMAQQIRLFFATREDAVAYAERKGIPYRVEEAHDRVVKPMSYADNFRTDRRFPWSH